MVDVASNYRTILQRIDEAAARAGRDPDEVKLLGAAKSQSVERMRAAIIAGVKLIGENYVQEAQAKKAEISERAEWHMIGHLQRNKAKAAVEVFDVIQSLDNIALARELDKEGAKRNKRVRALSRLTWEARSRNQVSPRSKAEDLLRAAGELSSLSIEGLMTVPPFRQNPEDVRPYFRRLRELRARLREGCIAKCRFERTLDRHDP